MEAIKKRFPEVKVRPLRGSPVLTPDRVRPDGLPYPDKTTADKLRRFRRPVDVQLYVRGREASYNFIQWKPQGLAPPGLPVAENVPFSSWIDVVKAGLWR